MDNLVENAIRPLAQGRKNYLYCGNHDAAENAAIMYSLLGCWAHARRKYIEALKEDKAGAEYALEQIALIYGVESMADDQGLDYQQRAALRARLAYPIMCAFEKWILKYMPKALPKGRMSQALTYSYMLFHRLSRYQLDGRYRIDNNLGKCHQAFGPGPEKLFVLR